jgi:hypothetical protein
MWAGVAQGGLVSRVLFSLYVNDMPMPSRHVELALYVDDTVIIATSRNPALLVSYLESYLSDLERWLREQRIAINVSKSNAMLFAEAGWRVAKPRLGQFLGEPIQWVDTACYLGVILDSRLTWRTGYGDRLADQSRSPVKAPKPIPNRAQHRLARRFSTTLTEFLTENVLLRGSGMGGNYAKVDVTILCIPHKS